MNHHKPFEYDPLLLEKCAKNLSSLNLEQACLSSEKLPITQHPDVISQMFSSSEHCGILFQLHATHYRRPGFQDLSFLTESSQNVNSKQNQHDPSIRLSSPQVQRRFCLFLQSVKFVYNHNAETSSRHRVTLNHFSDLDSQKIFPESGASWSAWTNQTSKRRNNHHRRLSPIHNLQLGHGSINKLNPKIHRPKKNGLPSRSLRIPENDRLPFESPRVPRALNGYLVAVKKNKEYDAFFDDIRDAWQGPDSQDFKSHLNWATEDNPDGVPLVHDAIDQGRCGSCWALAATGSLEASAARKAASDAYQGYRTTHMSHRHDPETLRQQAIATAQKVERRAMKILNVSIQELIDCDTTTDQGCTGGNPLLSFHFIHRYGLAAWDDYPYVGHENQCNTNSSQTPLATAQSWGIVEPNYENHMELVLRFIGPIAVGLNGASKSFLFYDGGIFDEPKCDQGPNHALLIVGYGEDVVDGSRVRYWIARNSWGTGWGENGGFVRIKRGSGKRGVAGVCGIARNPSVALGGYLLREEKNMLVAEGLDAFPRYSLDDPVFVWCSKRGLASRSYCLHVGGWVYDNRAWILGFLGFIVLLLTLWPLTLDIRRRRQRRLRRRELQERAEETQPKTESTPLLEDVTNPHGYNVRKIP